MRFLKDYFSFSRRERIGAIVLLVLTMVVFVLPDFFPEKHQSEDPAAFLAIKKQLDSLKNGSGSSGIGYRDSAGLVRDPPGFHKEKNIRLFHFDPNTLSADGWRSFGVADRTIQTIQKYLSKGGRFRSPQDLEKIYGLRRSQVELIRPFVRIDSGKDEVKEWRHDIPRKQVFALNRPVVREVDINITDSSGWIALPGIGARLAKRILLFREKLGGFYSVEQVREVYGLPDSTFQLIRRFLSCPNPAVEQMDVNTADVSVLKAHPYLRWDIANAIVRYRQQHGNFSSIDELKRIELITEDVFERVRWYLKV